MNKRPKKHLFVCVNCREMGVRKSCGEEGLKIRNKLVALSNPIKNKLGIRVNKSGCLDMCEEGPVLAIYPKNIWYKGVTIHDCEEIFQKSIEKDQVIKRLEHREDV